MKQKFTVLFDLDGTLIDTAPDLITAHNHVMKKFGYPTKTLGELKNAVGKGAKAMMAKANGCLLYTSPSPRDVEESRMPSSA